LNDESGDARRTEARAQAVDRVVDILEALSSANGSLTLDQVATRISTHRSVAYRMLRTLELRRVVERDAQGYRLGEMVLILANSVRSDLRDIAVIELTRLAERFGATAFIARDDGDGRSVCLQTVEPAGNLARVTIRPGTWGPMDQGAPALAILAGRAPQAGEPATVGTFRQIGYAVSAGNGTVGDGLQWVAAAIPSENGARTSVCLVFPFGALPTHEVGAALRESAGRIAAGLSSREGSGP